MIYLDEEDLSGGRGNPPVSAPIPPLPPPPVGPLPSLSSSKRGRRAPSSIEVKAAPLAASSVPPRRLPIVPTAVLSASLDDGNAPPPLVRQSTLAGGSCGAAEEGVAKGQEAAGVSSEAKTPLTLHTRTIVTVSDANQQSAATPIVGRTLNEATTVNNKKGRSSIAFSSVATPSSALASGSGGRRSKQALSSTQEASFLADSVNVGDAIVPFVGYGHADSLEGVAKALHADKAFHASSWLCLVPEALLAAPSSHSLCAFSSPPPMLICDDGRAGAIQSTVRLGFSIPLCATDDRDTDDRDKAFDQHQYHARKSLRDVLALPTPLRDLPDTQLLGASPPVASALPRGTNNHGKKSERMRKGDEKEGTNKHSNRVDDVTLTLYFNRDDDASTAAEHSCHICGVEIVTANTFDASHIQVLLERSNTDNASVGSRFTRIDTFSKSSTASHTSKVMAAVLPSDTIHVWHVPPPQVGGGGDTRLVGSFSFIVFSDASAAAFAQRVGRLAVALGLSGADVAGAAAVVTHSTTTTDGSKTTASSSLGALSVMINGVEMMEGVPPRSSLASVVDYVSFCHRQSALEGKSLHQLVTAPVAIAPAVPVAAPLSSSSPHFQISPTLIAQTRRRSPTPILDGGEKEAALKMSSVMMRSLNCMPPTSAAATTTLGGNHPPQEETTSPVTTDVPSSTLASRGPAHTAPPSLNASAATTGITVSTITVTSSIVAEAPLLLSPSSSAAVISAANRMMLGAVSDKAAKENAAADIDASLGDDAAIVMSARVRGKKSGRLLSPAGDVDADADGRDVAPPPPMQPQPKAPPPSAVAVVGGPTIRSVRMPPLALAVANNGASVSPFESFGPALTPQQQQQHQPPHEATVAGENAASGVGTMQNVPQLQNAIIPPTLFLGDDDDDDCESNDNPQITSESKPKMMPQHVSSSFVAPTATTLSGPATGESPQLSGGKGRKGAPQQVNSKKIPCGSAAKANEAVTSNEDVANSENKHVEVAIVAVMASSVENDVPRSAANNNALSIHHMTAGVGGVGVGGSASLASLVVVPNSCSETPPKSTKSYANQSNGDTVVKSAELQPIASAAAHINTPTAAIVEAAPAATTSLLPTVADIKQAARVVVSIVTDTQVSSAAASGSKEGGRRGGQQRRGALPLVVVADGSGPAAELLMAEDGAETNDSHQKRLGAADGDGASDNENVKTTDNAFNNAAGAADDESASVRLPSSTRRVLFEETDGAASSVPPPPPAPPLLASSGGANCSVVGSGEEGERQHNKMMSSGVHPTEASKPHHHHETDTIHNTFDETFESEESLRKKRGTTLTGEKMKGPANSHAHNNNNTAETNDSIVNESPQVNPPASSSNVGDGTGNGVHDKATTVLAPLPPILANHHHSSSSLLPMVNQAPKRAREEEETDDVIESDDLSVEVVLGPASKATAATTNPLAANPNTATNAAAPALATTVGLGCGVTSLRQDTMILEQNSTTTTTSVAAGSAATIAAVTTEGDANAATSASSLAASKFHDPPSTALPALPSLPPLPNSSAVVKGKAPTMASATLLVNETMPMPPSNHHNQQHGGDIIAVAEGEEEGTYVVGSSPPNHRLPASGASSQAQANLILATSTPVAGGGGGKGGVGRQQPTAVVIAGDAPVSSVSPFDTRPSFVASSVMRGGRGGPLLGSTDAAPSSAAKALFAAASSGSADAAIEKDTPHPRTTLSSGDVAIVRSASRGDDDDGGACPRVSAVDDGGKEEQRVLAPTAAILATPSKHKRTVDNNNNDNDTFATPSPSRSPGRGSRIDQHHHHQRLSTFQNNQQSCGGSNNPTAAAAAENHRNSSRAVITAASPSSSFGSSSGGGESQYYRHLDSQIAKALDRLQGDVPDDALLLLSGGVNTEGGDVMSPAGVGGMLATTAPPKVSSPLFPMPPPLPKMNSIDSTAVNAAVEGAASGSNLSRVPTVTLHEGRGAHTSHRGVGGGFEAGQHRSGETSLLSRTVTVALPPPPPLPPLLSSLSAAPPPVQQQLLHTNLLMGSNLFTGLLGSPTTATAASTSPNHGATAGGFPLPPPLLPPHHNLLFGATAVNHVNHHAHQSEGGGVASSLNNNNNWESQQVYYNHES